LREGSIKWVGSCTVDTLRLYGLCPFLPSYDRHLANVLQLEDKLEGDRKATNGDEVLTMGTFYGRQDTSQTTIGAPERPLVGRYDVETPHAHDGKAMAASNPVLG
jgi:hypothetical protein